MLLGIAAWYFVSFRLDGVIKQQIEQVGSQTMGTSVSVGSVTTDLKNGSLIISNITVANPPGYKNTNALSLNGIEAAIDYKTLDIKRIIVDKPEIVIEEKNGASNFTDLLAGMEDSPEPEPAEEGAEPLILDIHHFRMNESRAAFESVSLDHYSDLKVKAIEVKNVEGTPPEVAKVITREIVEEIVSAAAIEILKAQASKKIDDIFGRDKD
ncbi:MAG: hypothetical protein V2I48_09750 [Xanthomonadales bacterium]|nr:hypothetical protein [Xanthomonadales bacterium]